MRHRSGGPLRGFTVVEILIVFALVAMMLAIAAPNFAAFQRNSALTSSANSFLAALSAARAEAMRRQQRTFVIPRSGTDWSSGWIVFVDVDNDVATGSLAKSANDVQITQGDPLPSGITVTTAGFSDGGVQYAMFNGGGFMTLIDQTFKNSVLELDNGIEKRRIIATTAGRLRVCNPDKDSGCTTGL